MYSQGISLVAIDTGHRIISYRRMRHTLDPASELFSANVVFTKLPLVQDLLRLPILCAKVDLDFQKTCKGIINTFTFQ